MTEGAPTPIGPAVPPPPGVPVAAYPYPPPGYAPYPPSSKDGKTIALVAVVVITVLTVMVAATVVLAAVLYVMVSGLPAGPPMGNPETVGLAAGEWANGSADVRVLVAPAHGIGTAGMTFQVVDANGTLYFNGASGATQAVNGTSVAVTYRDADADGWMSADDLIQVRVRPEGDAGLLGDGTLHVFDADGRLRGTVFL